MTDDSLQVPDSSDLLLAQSFAEFRARFAVFKVFCPNAGDDVSGFDPSLLKCLFQNGVADLIESLEAMFLSDAIHALDKTDFFFGR